MSIRAAVEATLEGRDQRLVDRCDVDGIVTAIELYGCYDDDELFDLLESSFGAVQTQLGNAAPPAFLSLLKARLRANRSSESAGAAQPQIGAASPAASACQTPHGRRGDGGVRSSAPVRAPQPTCANPIWAGRTAGDQGAKARRARVAHSTGPSSGRQVCHMQVGGGRAARMLVLQERHLP